MMTVWHCHTMGSTEAIEGTAIDATPRQAAENFVASEYREGRLDGDGPWRVLVHPETKPFDDSTFTVRKVPTIAFVAEG